MAEGYILHIVSGDKFTSGYINFMKKYIKREQQFLIIGKEYKYFFYDNENIEIVDRGRDLIQRKENREKIYGAVKIIISGVFDDVTYIALYRNKILKKVYLHFWGGDFYCLRDKISMVHVMSYMYRLFKLRCIKKCKAFIFLLDTEQAQFEKICKYRKQCLVAAMPEDPMEEIDYEELMNEENHRKTSEKRILVGNSATKENHHIEVFKLLKRFEGKNIKVFVPLSYGNMEYKQEVMKKGREILGDIFVPIENYMDKKEYYRLLSSMDVGIFNNDRQQAMGNINIMLRIGKKLYLRKGTSMWESYLAMGAIINDIEELKNCSYEKMFSYDVKDREKSIQAIEAKGEVKRNIEQWEKIIYE